ncbi:hypothetical protein G9A89_001425 [Geosiphon pyriformis]|nr:hypothetical protein G9A89_001425 [Geosiphon pyriformis]
MSHCHNHHTYCSSAKTIRKNFLPWEPGLHQIRTTEHKPIIIANLAIENTMATQNDKASGTTNHVLLVVNNCSIKECGITFLVEKKCVTLHVNTQSSLMTE